MCVQVDDIFSMEIVPGEKLLTAPLVAYSDYMIWQTTQCTDLTEVDCEMSDSTVYVLPLCCVCVELCSLCLLRYQELLAFWEAHFEELCNSIKHVMKLCAMKNQVPVSFLFSEVSDMLECQDFVHVLTVCCVCAGDGRCQVCQEGCRPGNQGRCKAEEGGKQEAGVGGCTSSLQQEA